jgi:hypothetical protein
MVCDGRQTPKSIIENVEAISLLATQLTPSPDVALPVAMLSLRRIPHAPTRLCATSTTPSLEQPPPRPDIAPSSPPLWPRHLFVIEYVSQSRGSRPIWDSRWRRLEITPIGIVLLLYKDGLTHLIITYMLKDRRWTK